MYSDRQIAQALQLLSELSNGQRASEKTGVPRSTLNQWRIRYQADEEFAQRIDQVLDEGESLSSPLADSGRSHEGRVDQVASQKRKRLA